MSALNFFQKMLSPFSPTRCGTPSAKAPPLCQHADGAKQTGTASASLRVAGLEKEIFVKIASERWEWEQAFELVAANYQTRGYILSQTNGLYFTPYHALPETIVLVAKHEERVVATFTAVLDNWPLGLPLERLFPEEVEKLRQTGHRIGEATSLADRDLSPRQFVPVLQTMMQLSMQWGARQGVDTTVITVNPRHRTFYTRMLGFLSLGTCRPYAQVQGAPAEAFWVDWEQMKARTPHIYEQIFAAPLPSEVLAASRLSRNLIREFDRRAVRPSGPRLDDIFGFVDEFGKSRSW